MEHDLGNRQTKLDRAHPFTASKVLILNERNSLLLRPVSLFHYSFK